MLKCTNLVLFIFIDNNMLRITRLTDYSMILLAQMASSPKEVFKATELVNSTGLNKPTVSKLLTILPDFGTCNYKSLIDIEILVPKLIVTKITDCLFVQLPLFNIKCNNELNLLFLHS